MNHLRYAFRMLRKQPGFSALTVFTLALGIGATAAVFSLIQGVLLTPPPYSHPERLILIQSTAAEPRGWPSGQWQEWQREAHSLEAVAAYSWTFNFLILPQGSESLEGMAVTPEYFRVTGLQPILGRTFSQAEGQHGSAPVVILGYDLWRRRFHADRNILGKPVRLSRQSAAPRVIGVMPPGVRFLPAPEDSQEPNYNVNAMVDIWFPAAPDPARAKRPDWNIVARLRPGATAAQAGAQLSVLVQRESRNEPEYQGIAPRIQSVRDEMNRDGSRILLPLLGAAALVLLIACGNAAALLLVRGIQRQQEYAIRTALGVERSVLFRQISMESLLLALIGGGLGAALAFAAVRVFKTIAGHAVPRLDAVATGWPVLAWGLGAAVFAAVLAGLLPALRASSLDPAGALKSAGPKTSAGRGERRILGVVTMFQTALTLALLAGAGLLIRTMINLAEAPSGYDTAHILSMTVTAVNGKWLDFHRRTLEQVSAIPGVEHAAFAWGVPLTGNSWPGQLEIEDQPPALKASDKITMPLRAVTPGYFQMLGVQIARGRDFRSSDDSSGPGVAVVNEAFADRYFWKSSPLGKKIWGQGRNRPATEIVGVVTNGRMADLARAAEPEVYLPLWRAQAFSKDLVVRSAGNPAQLIPAIERTIRSIEPTAAVENIRTLEQIRGDSVAPRTFAMQLLVGFAAIGSLLSLVGIYGVLSLSVASRRRELAIRSAVGASAGHIRLIVFADGFRLISGGVTGGLLAALMLARALRSFLYGVEPYDPLTLIAAGAMFAAVALLACWAPGRRAAAVDPLEALRCD